MHSGHCFAYAIEWVHNEYRWIDDRQLSTTFCRASFIQDLLSISCIAYTCIMDTWTVKYTTSILRVVVKLLHARRNLRNVFARHYRLRKPIVSLANNCDINYHYCNYLIRTCASIYKYITYEILYY